ncbi:MAG: glycosyltransferase [Alistipes sp.]|nr:glycosyltransferase [Alistipes sp.]
MKLLTINSDPNAGGSTISLLHLLAGLKAKGADLLVVIPSTGFCSKQLEKLRIPYRINPYIILNVWPSLKCADDIWKFFPRLIRNGIYSVLAYSRLAKTVKEYRPDLIHSNNSLIEIGFRFSHRHGIPHVWHIREYGDRDFRLKYFPSARRQQKHLAESHTIPITEHLARHFNLDKKYRVIYNGICSTADVFYDPNKENYFLYVGAVNENKGVTDMISAYVEYCNPANDDKLVVIGRYNDEYLLQLKKLIADTSAESRVLFLGQTENPYRYMQKAKAMIVPSKCEGFGRITAEAMFNGCLVIGRNTGGTKEQFDNGLALTGKEIGLRFSSTQELVNALQQVDDYSETEKELIIKDAQKTVKTFYTIENNIEQTYEFLAECQIPTRVGIQQIG